MRIAIASSSLLALPTLQAVASSNHELVGIITTPDAPQGRGRTLAPSELALWASGSNHLIYKYSQETIGDFLRTHSVDLVITLSFGKIIREEALSIPAHGWLNIHFSQLPRWRGAAPIQRALLTGDHTTGLSIFKLDAGMDTGPIYTAIEYPIPAEATTESLLEKLSLVAGDSIVDVISSIEKGVDPVPQPEEGASRAEKIVPTEGAINWASPALDIERQVRALAGNIGVFSTFRGAKINMYSVTVKTRTRPSEFDIGEPVISGEKNEKLVIAASDGLLEFDEVKPAGKAKMKSSDFLRGARIEPSERFL